MQPALVVIVNNQADWQRVEHEGWYQIPKRSAPLPLAAEVLAFYFTSSFGDSRCSVACFAPVQGYRLARRSELMPEQSSHPRAGDGSSHCAGHGEAAGASDPQPASVANHIYPDYLGGAVCRRGCEAELWRAGEADVLAELVPEAIVKHYSRATNKRIRAINECTTHSFIRLVFVYSWLRSTRALRARLRSSWTDSRTGSTPG